MLLNAVADIAYPTMVTIRQREGVEMFSGMGSRLHMRLGRRCPSTGLEAFTLA